MEHRRLGRTGLQVSAFGLGCGNFGGIGSAPAFFGQGESEKEAHALLDEAVDLGMNFLDTADAYGGGRSEAAIGSWLKTKSADVRDRLLVSSKVANAVGEGPNQRGLSRRHILRQIDASLTRLGVDHLDMYLAHEPDPNTPLEETLEVFDALVRSGKVRYIGASNFPDWLLTKALWVSDAGGYQRFEWVQNSFNLIDQSDQTETLALCNDQQLGYTPFGPLGGGWLTGKYRRGEAFPEGSRMTLRPEPYLRNQNERLFDALEEFAGVAADLDISLAGLALAWLYRHPSVSASIVGPRTPEQYAPVHEAIELQISVEQWNEIGAIFR